MAQAQDTAGIETVDLSPAPTPTPTHPSYPCIAYVAGNMYLGMRHIRHPAFLRALHITHVLAISSSATPVKSDLAYIEADARARFARDAAAEGIEVLTIEANDTEGGHMLPLYEREDVRAFMTEGTAGENRCAVHCAMGQSRSVAMVGLHLIQTGGLSLLETLLLLLSARLTIEPRASFIEDMKRVEKEMGMEESFKEANLPGDRRGRKVSSEEIAPPNRAFFKKHISTVKELRKREPEPPETELEIYKKHRFVLFGQL